MLSIKYYEQALLVSYGQMMKQKC